MADEISIATTMVVRKGYLDWTRQRSRSYSLVSSAPAKAGGIISVGTTHEALPMADVASAGWARLENVDATNYIEVGVVVSGTFYPLLKLKAGECYPVRFSPSATIYVKANTADALLDYDLFDD